MFSSYSFNLYYIKGKDIILSDFLARQKIDDSNPHEVIPISFNMQNILYHRYYSICERKEEGKYLVQTRSQSKSSGITLPTVHGADKGINLSVQPGKQVIKPIVVTEIMTPTQIKPRIGQGKAGHRRKVKILTLSQPYKHTQMLRKPDVHKSEVATQMQTVLESRPQTSYTPTFQSRLGQ